MAVAGVCQWRLLGRLHLCVRLVYWASRLHLSGVSNKVLFLGYLLFISGMSAIVTGTIGFVATWAFVRVIYSRVRVD